MSDEQRLRVPSRVRKAIETLIEALEDKAADQLAAVVVHGSATRGDYRENASDVDLVVVLRDDPIALLQSIGPALQLARSSARIETMIVRESEIAPAADVFPLFYEDVAREGVALRGESPFAGLKIHDSHRRLRIEQELREARIRLRAAIADASAGILRVEGIVDRKLKHLRSPLHALLRQAEKAPEHAELADVLKAAGSLLGVEVAALLRAHEQPDEALPVLVELIDAAIARADSAADA